MVMNELQLERWKQLSAGLVRSYKSLTQRRKEKLLEEIDNCIEWVVCNGLETVDDWDSGVKYGPQWYEHHESASTRVDTFLWDNSYEFERSYRNGNIEVVRGRFGDMLTACVRAGFDMAISPSAGVIGFTVGDIRDIFEGTIPDWIAEHFDDPGALISAKNEEGVWL